MEQAITAFATVCQLAVFAVFAAEFAAYWTLPGWFAELRTRPAESLQGMPAAVDTSRLQGLAGVGAAVRYRWDPERQALLFARRYGVIAGEWGYAVGSIRFGPSGQPQVAWRPAPSTLLPGFFALGSAGLVSLVLLEGEPMGLIGVPLLGAMCLLMGVFLRGNAQATLDRVLLPELAGLLSAHGAPDASAAPSAGEAD